MNEKETPATEAWLDQRIGSRKGKHNQKASYCQIGTTGKGMPCCVNINTLAGLVEPCEVCAPNLQKMRDLMGWVPFRGLFHMSNKLADFQHDALLDRINAALPQILHGNDNSEAASVSSIKED